MNLTNRTLIIPEKSDAERDAVVAAWTSHGGTVLRLGRICDLPDTKSTRLNPWHSQSNPRQRRSVTYGCVLARVTM